MVVPSFLRRSRHAYSTVWRRLCLLLGCVVCLVQCSPGGDTGTLPTEPDPTDTQFVQQGAMEVLNLYRTALLQEDVDRLQELLDTEAAPQMLASLRSDFRTRTILDVSLSDIHTTVTATAFQVSFHRALSVQEPGLFRASGEQQTRLTRTVWRLKQRTSASGVVQFLIADTSEEGPEFVVTTPGQIPAGTLARVQVTETTGTFPIVGVNVEAPAGNELQALVAQGEHWQGSFMPPASPNPMLRVYIRGTDGAEVVVDHRYQVRIPGEGVVERVATVATPGDPSPPCFFAVAVSPQDGTVWGGANGGNAGQGCTPAGDAVGGAKVYRVRPEAPRAARFEVALSDDPRAQVDDIVVDRLGRVHFLIRAATFNKDYILDQGVLCPTVDAFDPRYPFRVRDPATGMEVPSPSVRAVAAEDGDIWLFASDDGAGRVTDNFRMGQCATIGGAVRYAPVFRRQDGLLSNSVQALVVGTDGTLWFGTAFGLTRLQQGQFTPVPFAPGLSLRGDVRTLEAFFQSIAQAVFAARPLTTVRLGDVSFVEQFGSPLVKADLISSAVEDSQGRLWVGTYGGGLRVVESRQPTPGDTRLLTRQNGLGSNIIAALAVAPDGAVWAATQKGASHIHTTDGTVTITNFSFLDGLTLGVRDVAVDTTGTAWLATDEGLFRVVARGGQVQGLVQDATGQPVVGADVRVLGTPFRTVTDATGYFMLVDLPSGTQQLFFDGRSVIGVPPGSALRRVDIAGDAHTLPVVVLEQQALLLSVAAAGNDVRVVVNTPVPLAVRATDGSGNPLAGIEVAFRLAEADRGTLSVTRAITDATGLAQTVLTVRAGGPIHVLASVDDVRAVQILVTGITSGTTLRLVRVSGNNQSGQPGVRLPEPLVVRLQDLFGNPVISNVAAIICRGEGSFLSAPAAPAVQSRNPACLSPPTERTASTQTNIQGEARFDLQIGPGTGEMDDVVVEVTVAALADGPAVQFLTIVGEVDTPDIPLDLAVAGDFLFVADRRSGLQVYDVSTPVSPRLRTTTDLDGTEVRVVATADRLYVATNFPPRLYILDEALQTLGRVQLLETPQLPNLQRHSITGLTIQGNIAYLVTEDRTENIGTLQVVNVGQPGGCVSPDTITMLSSNRPSHPRGIAVSGNVAYVPAGEAGLLVFDITASPPLHVHTLEGAFFSEITLANGLAYVVETTVRENLFTVLDLSTPTVPRRLPGALPIRMATQVAEVATGIVVDDRFAYLAGFAYGLQVIDIFNPRAPRLVGRGDTPSQALNVTLAGDFLYVSDQIFGVQVIPRPMADTADADGDGIPDAFDAFPTDPAEFLDTDRDGLGDTADLDDDNDGFTDEEENQATTDPLDPQSFPVALLPAGTTTIIVDHACPPNASPCPLDPRQRNGTPAAPYRSITEALQALRRSPAPQVVETLLIRPGTYSPLTTQEVFPLDLSRLAPLTIRSTDPDDPQIVQTTVIDAAFTGDILFLDVLGSPSDAPVTIAGLTLTHGAHGVIARGSTALTLRRNRIAENIFAGVSLGDNRNSATAMNENVIELNGDEGINLARLSQSANVSSNIVCNNGGEGVVVDLSDSIDIDSNVIGCNGNDGIRVRDTMMTRIAGNIISANGSLSPGSIRIAVPERCRFQGQSCRFLGLSAGGCRSVGDGIATAGTTRRIEITANTIENNRRDGIFQRNPTAMGADNNVITNNVITRNRMHGLNITQGTVTITNNIIEHHDDENGPNNGMNIRNATAGIIANMIRRNAGHGIALFEATTATIAANHIADNLQRGIDLGNGSAATIRDNNVDSNTGEGILVLGATATISGGTISMNTDNGLRLRGSSRTRVGCDGNTVTIAQNAGAPIVVDGSSQLELGPFVIFRDNDEGDEVSGRPPVPCTP